ncbi:MAG: TlpA family protein disulfide reductase [Deltaproteobacteria bacterium]|nr:TlpA family protein disulfide reductase [Deltaproteobacteria bacterium]
MYRRLLRLASNILIFMLLILGVEWWQASSMRSGMWPESARLLPSLEGTTGTLPEAGGGVTLVYVFAPWCGVCRATAANLNVLKERGFQVSALALAYEQEAEVRAFVTSTGLSTTVLLGSEDIARSLAVSAFPSYFILSPTGRILKAWSGYATTAGLILKMWAIGLTSPS